MGLLSNLKIFAVAFKEMKRAINHTIDKLSEYLKLNTKRIIKSAVGSKFYIYKPLGNLI